jgi:predicted dithiol-disulfide oxidoreductase (DUF899 family)
VECRAGDGILEIPQDSPGVVALASVSGVDRATYRCEGPGVSAFTLEDGVVYHTYSAYERGLDILWGMCQWLDRAPRGATKPAPGGAATTNTTTSDTYWRRSW